MSRPSYRKRCAVFGNALVALLLGVSLDNSSAQGEAPPARPLGLDLYMPIPEDNPLTDEKVALGRSLFSDTILSLNRRLACVNCHDPERAFTDGRAVAVGIFGRTGTRNVPTLINRGYGTSFFWDGRMASLEAQVLQPIQDRTEMDLNPAEAADRLQRHRVYPGLFRRAFGRELSVDDLARALASYVRSILSGNSPFDHYMNGERDALSEQAREGFRIFHGKGNCTACHIGPTLTDERFHNTGVAWQAGELLDQGRYMVTGQDEDRGAFKTPTLREVSRTAPYMHDGSLSALEDVIEFYDRGGNPNPYLDSELRPLKLRSEEKRALIRFLESLTGSVQEETSLGERPGRASNDSGVLVAVPGSVRGIEPAR